MSTWSGFSKVQPLAGKIMINSIERSRLSHAYLIQGTRGTGKKTLALLLAMTIYCERKVGVEPCQDCHMCKRILSRNHPDVHWVEKDGQSIKNHQIDVLRKEFAHTGLESTKKVYIITDAESLYVNAANRILKFLEEPNIEATAILLTENIQGVLPTIQSRCQIIDLKPLNQSVFQEKLIQLQITENNARFLSALTNNIDEAIQLNTDANIYNVKDLVRLLINILLVKYNERYLFIHQEWLTKLKDKEALEQGLDLLLLAFKDVMHFQMDQDNTTLFFVPNDELLVKAANHFPQHRLLHILKSLLQSKQNLKQNVHQTLVMEQLVLQL